MGRFYDIICGIVLTVSFWGSIMLLWTFWVLFQQLAYT